MAGTVAKFYHPENYEVLGGKHTGPQSKKPMRNMEENDILNYLNDESFDRRKDILQQLSSLVRRNGGGLPFVNKRAIFGGLALALADDNWEIRLKCIQLINEVIPAFGDDLDSCMEAVLPKLVRNIGDTKTSIRRAVIQTLHVYMKNTYEIDCLFRAIVRHGLEIEDQKIKKQVIISIPLLFTPEFAQENFGEIARSLVKRLCDTSDVALQQHVLLSLEKIKDLVGESTFNSYLQKLSPPMRAFYLKLTDRARDQSDSSPYQNRTGGSQSERTSKRGQYSAEKSSRPDQITFAPNASHYLSNMDADAGTVVFGVIPNHVMERLHDRSDFRSRAQAVEELKIIIKDLHEINLLAPHTMNFISFLNNLLDDYNFKIITVALEILGLLVDKFQQNLGPHLRPFVAALTKRMDDNKVVVRQVIIKVVMQLMQTLGAKEVLSIICENLSHRNSRVRAETLNVIIASLLTFPSYSFDLGALCKVIAPTLVDPKRQVRQACLECYAVLASHLGAGKLQPLVQAVDSVELSFEGDGAMVAVQARLARRQLPRLNSEGLVDYATPIPSSADTLWIISGTPSSSRNSANRSAHAEFLELEPVTHSGRSTPSMDHSQTPTPRVTSGALKSRFPWEQEAESNQQQQNGELHSDRQASNRENHPPSKSRTTWAERHDKSQTSRHKNHEMGSPPQYDEPVDPKSYRGIYVNKYKRQSSDAPSQPFSVYNPSDDGYNSKNSDVRKSFSNSWPDTKMFEDAGMPNKRRLDPISAPETPTVPQDWPDEVKSYETSPIPMKPTLVSRVSSSRNKVPPIPASREGSDRDSILDGGVEDETREEMDSSLRHLRTSAKKKVEKMFERGERRTQRSPSPSSSRTETFDDSALFSDDTVESASTTQRRRDKKGDSPFESKPRLPRKASMTKSDMQSAGGVATDSRSSFHNLDYLAHGGVTFPKNRSSDVSIVGHKFGEDSQGDVRPPQQQSKREQRRKVQKASVLSPLGMANPNAVGAMEWDDDRVPGGVVGRSVFESGHPGEQSMSNMGADRPTRRQSRSEVTDPRNYPGGVFGIGVKQNSLDRTGEDEEDEEDDEDDDVSSMSMSETTRKNMAIKQKQKAEEVERRRKQAERERKQWEQEERKRKQREEELQVNREKQRQQERLRQLADEEDAGFDDLTLTGHISNQRSPSQHNNRPPRHPVPKKKNKIPNEDRSPVPSGPPALSESDTQEEILKPLKEPNSALNDAMKNIANSQWDIKCSGLFTLRRLANFHPNVLCGPNLHSIILAVIGEVKNLRSQVSRLAIVTLGDMYVNLKKSMEHNLDQTTKVLLAKNGESNGFIREDVEKTLQAMVENMTPQRAVLALIAGGASHKNQAVRKTTSQFLAVLVDRMGPGYVLSGVKDVTDKILPVAAQFVQDNSPETRYNGQKILYALMSHEMFDKMMTKHVSATTLRNVQDKLESLRKKGLGDPPSQTPSAKGTRSGQGTRSSTRGNSASSSEPGSAPSTAPSGIKRRSGHSRTDEATMESIKSMTALMGGTDWRDRQKGIQQFQNMTDANPQVVGNNIVKIFDKFSQCLKDSNSKVNLLALTAMRGLTPLLSEYMSSILAITVSNIAVNLSSKNRDIYEAASSCLDGFMDELDGVLLIQPFVNQVTSGNARIKPDMIERLSYMVGEVYPRKSTSVMLHVLPLLWTLLGSPPSSGSTPGASGNMRTAVTNLVSALYAQMGNRLIELARGNSNVTPRMLQTLQDMVEHP